MKPRLCLFENCFCHTMKPTEQACFSTKTSRNPTSRHFGISANAGGTIFLVTPVFSRTWSQGRCSVFGERMNGCQHSLAHTDDCLCGRVSVCGRVGLRISSRPLSSLPLYGQRLPWLTGGWGPVSAILIWGWEKHAIRMRLLFTSVWELVYVQSVSCTSRVYLDATWVMFNLL